MEINEAIKRAEELRPLLKYYTQKYFDDEQVVSDYEYDMLMRELKQIEREYPELITKDSPTQRVGASIKKGFEKVTHEVPLQSLQDVFSFGEVEEFEEKMEKASKQYGRPLDYVVETKIDGLSASLEYRDGKLWRAATRGDGQVGENVTDNINYNYEITFNYVRNRLRNSTMVTTNRLADTATDTSILTERENACEALQAVLQENNIGMTASCSVSAAVQVTTQTINYEELDMDFITSNIAEFEGFYPEYELNESVTVIEQELENNGYTCQRNEYNDASE